MSGVTLSLYQLFALEPIMGISLFIQTIWFTIKLSTELKLRINLMSDVSLCLAEESDFNVVPKCGTLFGIISVNYIPNNLSDYRIAPMVQD